MKKLIRSTSIFRAESGPSASAQPMQAQPADAWEAPSPAPMQTAIVTTKVQPTRWREPEPIDTGYTESYERECIQQAQCPELPPSRPVTASEALGAILTMPKVFRGRERDAIVQAYRRYDRRSSIGLIPLHSDSDWVILEHADGQHTAFNADFGGHPHG